MHEVLLTLFFHELPKVKTIFFVISKKMSPRFCGPFQTLKRIGQVAHALDLPKDCKIHNVFHASLLRRYMSDSNHVLPYLPQVAPEGEMLVERERILKVDLQHLMNRSFMRFFIEWKKYHEDEASWDIENEFKETLVHECKQVNG